MKEIEKISIEWRGRLLHYMTHLELSINYCLMRHFCGDDVKKSEDFLIAVLGDDKLALMQKAQSFCEIAKRKNEKLYKDYKSTRTPDKGNKPHSLQSDLVWIIEYRNVFAHRVMGLSLSKENDNIIGEKISFVKVKNGIGANQITRDGFKELVELTKMLAKYIVLFGE
jgi:hypothetical protein